MWKKIVISIMLFLVGCSKIEEPQLKKNYNEKLQLANIYIVPKIASEIQQDVFHEFTKGIYVGSNVSDNYSSENIVIGEEFIVSKRTAINGINVGFLLLQESDSQSLDMTLVKDEYEKLKKDTDYVIAVYQDNSIANYYQGDYPNRHTYYQRQKIKELGIDLLVGIQNQLQPLRYENNELVIYSLGAISITEPSYMVQVQISKEEDKISDVHSTIIPLGIESGILYRLDATKNLSTVLTELQGQLYRKLEVYARYDFSDY